MIVKIDSLDVGVDLSSALWLDYDGRAPLACSGTIEKTEIRYLNSQEPVIPQVVEDRETYTSG